MFTSLPLLRASLIVLSTLDAVCDVMDSSTTCDVISDLGVSWRISAASALYVLPSPLGAICRFVSQNLSHRGKNLLRS